MRRKITIEFIRFKFEEKGWTLISTVYINSTTKLDYICPKGHTGSMTWNNWRSGHDCLTCSGNKKYTIEFIKSEFEKKGWTLVSKKYINNRTPLKYICPKGHPGSIAWGSWLRGIGCAVCAGVKKLTIEFVRSEFEKEGWICISKEYINSWSKLEYICPEGHHGSITWINWSQGNGCPICSGVKKYTIEFVKSEFEKKGWVCTSEKYTNIHSKLNYICPEGHHGSITWSHWNQGVRCSTCAIINKIGSGNPNWQGGISKESYCQEWTKEYKEFIKERDGYKCMNPYCFHKTGHAAELIIHHIDGNKKNCRSENLITLCRSCHGMVNKDKEWHEAWYKAIMYRRYGYTYDNN